MMETVQEKEQEKDDLVVAAKREALRTQFGQSNPEPSLGARLGQVGLLGWIIVLPALATLWFGRKLDQWLDTGIVFSAALVMLGIGCGFWFAWRWMHKQ